MSGQSDDMFYEVCHYCFGKGYLEDEGYAECPYCEGTGFEEDILSCTHCEDDFEDVFDCDNIEGGCGCCPYDEPICKNIFE